MMSSALCTTSLHGIHHTPYICTYIHIFIYIHRDSEDSHALMPFEEREQICHFSG